MNNVPTWPYKQETEESLYSVQHIVRRRTCDMPITWGAVTPRPCPVAEVLYGVID